MPPTDTCAELGGRQRGFLPAALSAPAAPRRRAPRRGGSQPECRGTFGGPSLDHLIRPQQERLRDCQAKGLGGLEVDDQLELGGLLDREVAGFRTPENL